MNRKIHLYYITPFGVISFTEKYVFINGRKTKDSYKLRVLLKKLVPDKFTNENFFLFGVWRYIDLKWTLYRVLRTYDLDLSVQVTCVSDSFCHKASDIFSGQYCTLPKYDLETLPF